jgi:hypothetical protein
MLAGNPEGKGSLGRPWLNVRIIFKWILKNWDGRGLTGFVLRGLLNIVINLRGANLTFFQKSTYYSGINIFNNLPSSLKSLMNEKAEFKVALKRYLNTCSFYSVDEFLLSKNDSSF